jgi:hypothetical protein
VSKLPSGAAVRLNLRLPKWISSEADGMTLEALGFGMRDYLAVVAGGVAYFAPGALWFSTLLGNRWMAATARS